MKNKLLFAGMASAALLTAAVTTSQAAPTAMSDAGLDTISGKANNVTSATLDVSTTFGNDQSANVQWGFYQWYDDHTVDNSTVKGGNQMDGASSSVQATVMETNNALFWGGLGQNAINSVSIGTGGANMAYGTFAAGGF
jgi:hypothetical protein